MSKVKGAYRHKKKKGRAYWLPIAFYGGLVFIAVVSFVLGFGLGMGWDTVAAWFTSKWAALTIVMVVSAGVLIIVVSHHLADKRMVG